MIQIFVAFLLLFVTATSSSAQTFVPDYICSTDTQWSGFEAYVYQNYPSTSEFWIVVYEQERSRFHTVAEFIAYKTEDSRNVIQFLDQTTSGEELKLTLQASSDGVHQSSLVLATKDASFSKRMECRAN